MTIVYICLRLNFWFLCIRSDLFKLFEAQITWGTMLPIKDATCMYFDTISMRKHSSFAKPNKICNITRYRGGQEAEGFLVLQTFSSPKGTNYHGLNFLEWKQCTRLAVSQNSGFITHVSVWFLRISVCFQHLNNTDKSFRHYGSYGHKWHFSQQYQKF